MSSLFEIDSKGLTRCLPFAEFVWQKHSFGSRQANPTALTLRQVHSNVVLLADNLADRQAEGDGLVTLQPGLSIGIRTADCVPLLFLDRRTRAVAAVHAGWRGTAAGIVERTVAYLGVSCGTLPEDLLVAIGPAIRPCCYQVGIEVARQFAGWPSVVRPDSPNHFRLDLAAANGLQLSAAGIPESSIFDCGLCTSCRPDLFFSYRRDPADGGRMLSAISRIA